jgi:DNA processing protein
MPTRPATPWACGLELGYDQPGRVMTGEALRRRVPWAALTCVAEPGDQVLGRLLRQHEPAALVAAIVSGRPAGLLAGAGTGHEAQAICRALERWTSRAVRLPDESDLATWAKQGIRLVCPVDEEWPTQLQVLGDVSPVALWLRGQADLRYACLRSVSVVGSRAATPYGTHVGGEMAAALGERQWAVISGGAYGIDGAAHRGAIAAEGLTIAVLAGGVDRSYPAGHADLFDAITAQGALVSEWPPGRRPTRHGFLTRNRVIAALTRGTVVVEAGLRSGALSTARHARDLCRPLMAVPGPVTSAASAGCHEIIRNWQAACVTNALDVLDHVAAPGEHVSAQRKGPILARDQLDLVTSLVLDAVPAHRGAGPMAIAVSAGVDADTVVRCLGALAATGFIDRCPNGWRLRPAPS